MIAPKSLEKKLKKQIELNAFRYANIEKHGVDFDSNDYLGIARLHFESKLAHGATGSRLISGHFKITEELEKKAALLFGKDTATLFNSGYDANLGFYSCVPQRSDTVIYDEFCHASIRDGIKLGFAKAYKFKHNNLNHLEEQLKQQQGDVYVSVESIYSMDGDTAPLVEIANICEKYKAYLVVDEAHSGGLYGGKGEGLVSQLGLNNSVFAKLITFGKAYGSHGAVFLGGKNLNNYLINFSRPLIYTTGLPPSAQDRIVFAMDQVKKAVEERKLLRDNIIYFKQLARKNKLNLIESNTAIQANIVSGNDALEKVVKKVTDAGFLVKPIIAPTVPLGEERIRICLHSYNTKEEISTLIDLLK